MIIEDRDFQDHFLGVGNREKFVNYIREKFNYELQPWDFVVTNDGVRDLAYCLNPNRGVERIDNIPETSKLRLKNTKHFEPLDIYQKCAIYAMNEADAALITGRFGSGKTLLATAMALSVAKRKIFITRPPIGISRDYDIGFLPGSKEEKMIEWAGGFLSALNFLYRDARGYTYEMIKNQLFFEKFEIIPLNMIQGVSILEGEVLIVDEAQLVTREYMSMVLSRMSEGSKLFLLGDINQTYSTISKKDSGLYRLQEILPHEAVAWVDLQKIYRNKLTELAIKLLE